MPPLTDAHREYWRQNLWLTARLLAVWFVVTFVVVWYADTLNAIELIGPLGFYMGAQGSLIVYVLLIGYYAHRMDRLDRAFDVAEDD